MVRRSNHVRHEYLVFKRGKRSQECSFCSAYPSVLNGSGTLQYLQFSTTRFRHAQASDLVCNLYAYAMGDLFVCGVLDVFSSAFTKRR
jgi:hypothetical protein